MIALPSKYNDVTRVDVVVFLARLRRACVIRCGLSVTDALTAALEAAAVLQASQDMLKCALCRQRSDFVDVQLLHNGKSACKTLTCKDCWNEYLSSRT